MSVAAATEPRPPARPRSRGTACHIALVGDVSGTRATRLETELLTVAASVDRVIVNLSRVTHLSLDAMRALERARTAVLARRGQFDVHAMSAAATLALARAGVRWPRSSRR